MKAFLDDLRTPPASWTFVRLPGEAIRLFETGTITDSVSIGTSLVRRNL
jgi:hypothetical protein